MNFTGKLFIVSGAGSGIGKACTELLLNSDATVIGFDIKDSVRIHEKYIHYMVDVKNEQKVKQIVDEIEKKYEKIDGLVNCAGVFANSKPFYDLSIVEWNNVIETNLTGVFVLSKYVASNMIKFKAGKIVNISCIRSKIFRPNMADYAAAKGGVVALTSAMALDLAVHNIRVNSVAPGFTYTGMTSNSFDNDEIRRSSESLIPVGKIAKSEDIANVVLFLLSEMADYINGETIFVDGGYRISK